MTCFNIFVRDNGNAIYKH